MQKGEKKKYYFYQSVSGREQSPSVPSQQFCALRVVKIAQQ